MGELVVDNVVECYAAPRLDFSIQVFARTKGGYDDRNFIFPTQPQIMIEPDPKYAGPR
jgi:hypothetical protein